MHVSIERYMDRLLSAATDNCTMIFGVRDASYGPDSFKDLFEEVIYLPEVTRPFVFAFVFKAEAGCVFRKLTKMGGHFPIHLGYQQVAIMTPALFAFCSRGRLAHPKLIEFPENWLILKKRIA